MQREGTFRGNRCAGDFDATSGVVVQLLRRDLHIRPAGAGVYR